MQTSKNCENKTDEELVDLTLKDKDYFACIISRYEEKLLRYIKRITNMSNEESEDILQETFIKAYYNLNSFDLDLKFSSWIYRITHNQTINAHRKNKARPQGNSVDIEDHVLENIIQDFDFVEEIDSKYLAKDIKKILDKLDEKYKEILILRFFEEKDYKEISDILKKPMGTVATLINRAKKQFKDEYQKIN